MLILSNKNCPQKYNINTFFKRNIFEENGKINYLNYNSFIYNIDSNEEELAKLILPGKCLFVKKNNLNFVTYLGEGFNKDKLDILNKFYSKYAQNELNNDGKSKIINYIKVIVNLQNIMISNHSWIQCN